MLIDLSELVELIDRVGETKTHILESCITPKHWSELVEITKKSEPTLLVHVNDLIKMRLLEKDENERTYLTTARGVEFLKLEPHVRSTQKGTNKTYFRLITRGIELGHLSMKEKLEFQILGADGLRLDRTLKKVYLDAVQATQQAVTVWIPKGFSPDKETYELIYKLIGKFTQIQPDQKFEKLTMMIEFDLPTALDMSIRDEPDEKVKARLEKDKDVIIRRIYKNWHRLFR